DEKGRTRYYPNYPYNDLRADPFLSIGQTEDDSGKNIGLQLNGFTNPDEYQRRFTFHSPDTSFYQPSIGSYIELDHIAHGTSSGHFVPVEDHPKYQMPSRAAYATVVAITMGLVAAGSEEGVGFLGIDMFGGAKSPWETAMTNFTALMDIMKKAVPENNVAYQFNSVGDYSFFKKERESIPKRYLLSDNNSSRYISDGLVSVGDKYRINNYLRESSVFLKTQKQIP